MPVTDDGLTKIVIFAWGSVWYIRGNTPEWPGVWYIVMTVELLHKLFSQSIIILKKAMHLNRGGSQIATVSFSYCNWAESAEWEFCVNFGLSSPWIVCETLSGEKGNKETTQETPTPLWRRFIHCIELREVTRMILSNYCRGLNSWYSFET